jgi:hypothetical protein
MKKGLLLLLAGLMAFGVAVQSMAGGSRLGGMAADARIVEDLNLVINNGYANKALEYGNILDVRLVTAGLGDEWGGLFVKDEAIGVIGVYVNNPAAASLNTALPAGGTDPLQLFWAKSFQGANFGVELFYDGAGSDQNNNRDFGVNAGLGLDGGETFSQVNLHAGFETASNTTNNTSAANAPSRIIAGALLQKDMDSNNNMRLFGDFAFLSNATSGLVGAASSFAATTSEIDVQVGAGWNRKVNGGKGLLSTGAIIGYYNVSVGSASVADYTLDWHASVEAQIASWLTARTGVMKRIYQGNTFVKSVPVLTFATGASVNFENFTLDLNVNPGSFQTALNPNPGSGIFYNGPIVTVASADMSYKFD